MKKQIFNRNNADFLDSVKINNQTYQDYLNRFERIAMSRFEWINLPESMNSEFLEKCLYYYGCASLLYDNNVGFINLKASINSGLNLYELPTSLNCYSLTINTKRKVYDGIEQGIKNPEEFCILVQNNWNSIPTISTLELFAYRLYEIERTCDININAHKTPIIIKTTPNLLLTFKNLWNEWIGNKPFIMAHKTLFEPEVPFSVLNTNVPYIIDKLQDYKKSIWNEALTFLGINTIELEKRERLIKNETETNNELINYNLQSYLLFRKKACEQFNQLFNLSGDNQIDVKIRSDLYNTLKQVETTIQAQGDGKNG